METLQEGIVQPIRRQVEARLQWEDDKDDKDDKGEGNHYGS